jgi:hypothetical protein
VPGVEVIFLGGRRFRRDEEVTGAVKAWLNGLTAESYDEDIHRLVIGCDGGLNVGGECVKKM